MANPRSIHPAEADLWLGVLLDAAFDPTSRVLNLARSAEIANQKTRSQGMVDALRLTARDGKCQLLSLAGDFTAYGEEYGPRRRAELLLNWANRWIQPQDWCRLAATVRKRRARMRF
jgi:hypothetical protein